MSDPFQLIQQLVLRGQAQISEHRYDELAANDLQVKKPMTMKRQTQLVSAGEYAARVEVKVLASVRVSVEEDVTRRDLPAPHQSPPSLFDPWESAYDKQARISRHQRKR